MLAHWFCHVAFPRVLPEVFNWSNSESHQKKRQSCLLLATLHIKSPLPSLFPFFWRFPAQSIHQFATLSWALQMPHEALLGSSLYDLFPFNSPFPPLKRAFFVGTCALKGSHQHSPGLRPNFQADQLWI